MEIKYLAQENEIQKIYNDLGLIVPVGDLSTTKAPAIQPLPTSSTQTTVTAQFNVMSGGDITALSYKVNDGEAVSLTPAKGVVTITLEDLEYNSGPYEIELTATNETGSTVTSSTIDLQHYTNWATADEVLDGNKFIGEDGQEAVGTYVPEEPATGSLIVTANGEYTTEGTEWVGFDDVFVDVPTGPDAGGAVISGVALTYREDSNLGNFSEIAVTFSQLPDWDFTQHDYFATLYTTVSDNYCGDYNGEKGVGQGIRYIGARLSSTDCGSSSGIQDPADWVTQNQLDMSGDRYPTVDSDTDPAMPDMSQLQSPADGVLVIYEDKIWNQKWIIPCTITTTIIPEQNAGE